MANIIANGHKTHTNGVTNGLTNGHRNGYLNGKSSHVSHPSDLYHVNDLILQDEDRAMEVSMASIVYFYLNLTREHY